MIRRRTNPDDTQKTPVSSARFRTTAHLHDQSGVRYTWSHHDLVVTGSEPRDHVRAWELIDIAPEEELWVEIPLQEALVAIATSRCFSKDVRHPVVRSYVQVWETMHEHVENLERMENEEGAA